MSESSRSLPVLLTTKEVAEWLQVSKDRVYTMCSQHEFPHIKISNRRTRYSKDAIIAWLEERSVGEGINN